ncbi:roadblock/LC7 domain-containing protein [Deinococcus rubellus]|uniref:Roadblock/LC7 domain-containing protein n=1 Tax=Deinococcus rubellus TaxID=1889240 RepID=A0ABY5YKS6_9DEIO|nr:roadblock/LC7 domain-containing protein [Deinococcus rubellus]UWX64957.1 roadblock/LC7 domain-containing protein [Deinococcus rubellus]
MPAEPPLPTELMNRLLDTKGVRFAALIGSDSQVLSSAGSPVADASFVQAARAVAQSLSATVGGQPLRDLLMDFADGPVLLTPTAKSDHLLVVGFDDVGNLGRVRFAVKREIGKL